MIVLGGLQWFLCLASGFGQTWTEIGRAESSVFRGINMYTVPILAGLVTLLFLYEGSYVRKHAACAEKPLESAVQI